MVMNAPSCPGLSQGLVSQVPLSRACCDLNVFLFQLRKNNGGSNLSIWKNDSI